MVIEEFENKKIREASFNQASFQQIRLNELFSRIDKLSTAPLYLNINSKVYNYEIIFRDLISCFLTISAKLDINEKIKMENKRKEIQEILLKNPPAATIIDHLNRERKSNSKEALYIILDKLLDYRLELELLMDKYGFGNPSKEEEEGYD